MAAVLVLLGIVGIAGAVALTVYLNHLQFHAEKRNYHKALVRALFAVSVALLLAGSSWRTVDAGTIGVVTRFGKPVMELFPGAHLVVPVADTVTPISVRTRIVKPSEDAASLDLQVVTFEVTFAYHVDPQYATYVYVQLNDDAENRVIIPAVLEAIKSVTAKYSVQELIEKRPAVRDEIETFVRSRIGPYHLVAETTSITNFSFSKQFEDSIEAKVTAEQLAEKAQNDLQRIQIEAQQKIAAAQGEAKALALQKAEITPELVQLRTVELMHDKWDGHLPNVMVGSGGISPLLELSRAAGR